MIDVQHVKVKDDSATSFYSIYTSSHAIAWRVHQLCQNRRAMIHAVNENESIHSFSFKNRGGIHDCFIAVRDMQ